MQSIVQHEGRRRALGLGTFALITAAAGIWAATANAERPADGTAQLASKSADQVEPDGRYTPLPITERETARLHVDLVPVDLGGKPADPINGARGDDCQATVSHTDASFEGGAYVLQGGFAEEEVAIASYTLPADAFPIRLDSAEMIFGTQNTSVTTTTEWSFIVWDGTPDNGSIVAVFSSDDVILPHIVLPPGTNGVNVLVTVDPGDPEQIIIENTSGTNTFSIGYRIDVHNNQTQNPCLVAPPSTSNAFPATDTSGLSAPNGNWLTQWDGLLCLCPGAGDTFPFSMLGPCQPSGDWVMRATYTSTNCSPALGACCIAPGTCEDAYTEAQCDAVAGVFYGDQSICANITCDPFGACCLPDGSCMDPMTEAACVDAGGTYLGDQESCPGPTCNPEGACCFGPEACATLTESDCATADGVFGGVGTTCATYECDPTGACCLPDGTCADGLIEDECVNEPNNGVFQGRGTTCADVGPCPEPIGACCLANGSCLSNQTQSNCEAIPGATWGGPATTCDDGNGNGTADACEAPCPSDLTGDSTVNADDLFELLGAWGDCVGCPSDLTGDDIVNADDLFQLLGSWGDC